MLDKIREKERQARLLEPSPVRRKREIASVNAYIEEFLTSLSRRPAYEDRKAPGWGIRPPEGAVAEPPQEGPRSLEALLSILDREVDHRGLNPASGGHMGYIPGGGLYASALGDYLAAVTNRYASVHYASPGAVAMENGLIRWMAQLVGFPRGSGGFLASGGSQANLAAVVAARDAMGMEARRVPKAVVYLTAQTHHCVDKGLRIAGMGQALRRMVPMDDRYRMQPDALARMVAADRDQGLLPWMVVASAGSTDAGAVDSLDVLGRLASKEKLWFHIDAAYGGFFLLSAEGRRRLKGIRMADSVVMDPHKGLFLPYGTGALLVRDLKHLQQSFGYSAAYLDDALDAGGPSPADISPELSRHFRGLRVWMALHLHGLAPFRAALEEKMLLARYFYAEARKLGLELGPPPELSVVLFRSVPQGLKGDQDALNRHNAGWVKALAAEGKVFLSGTTIAGEYWIRLAVLSFRTHLRHIQMLLQSLKRLSAL